MTASEVGLRKPDEREPMRKWTRPETVSAFKIASISTSEMSGPEGLPVIRGEGQSVVVSNEFCRLFSPEPGDWYVTSRDDSWAMKAAEFGKDGWRLEEGPRNTDDEVEQLVDLIAQAMQACTRGMCIGLGDYTHLPWSYETDKIREGYRDGVRHIMNNPGCTPVELHNLWCEIRTADGWVYGEFKDVKKKTHPALVPFEELPAIMRAKTFMFHHGVCQLGSVELGESVLPVPEIDIEIKPVGDGSEPAIRRDE